MLIIKVYVLDNVQGNHAATGAAHTNYSTGGATGHAHRTDLMPLDTLPEHPVITKRGPANLQGSRSAGGAAHTSLSTGAATGHARCTDFMPT